MDYEAARRNMVESQIRTNKVTHAALLDALSAVPRERFLPPDRAFAAYVDDDVLVAPGRYLMEPMVFARLVQLAEPAAGDRALLVGAGAGYGAAVLARLVASVTALESDPALAARGKPELATLAVENRHPGGRPPGPGLAGQGALRPHPHRGCRRGGAPGAVRPARQWRADRGSGQDGGDGPRDAVHRAEQGHLPSSRIRCGGAAAG